MEAGEAQGGEGPRMRSFPLEGSGVLSWATWISALEADQGAEGGGLGT